MSPDTPTAQTPPREVLLGNGAVAQGLLEGGCRMIAAYPGTPSSEILEEAVRFKKRAGLDVTLQWSVNEKVAYDVALASAYAEQRAATVMKQVGLNVASDSFMSSAYTGTAAGFVVVACDDPGPHSSQTEQDSRLFARFAGVPALDPATPKEARLMAMRALDISEQFEIPALLRLTTRVCHARQAVPLGPYPTEFPPPKFHRNPHRWAATPRYRFTLHQKLNAKLRDIRRIFEEDDDLNPLMGPSGPAPLGIVSAGVWHGFLLDVLEEYGWTEEIPILRIGSAYPAPLDRIRALQDRCDRVLILEGPMDVIEAQILDRRHVLGRAGGFVPSEGEMPPAEIATLVEAARRGEARPSLHREASTRSVVAAMDLPARPPSLCPGCPHRAAFFAIRKTFPTGVYTSDIGCYTLGLNLGAVDTVLDMGAGVTLASGLYQAFRREEKRTPIIATVGDSTFYHACTAPLINAVQHDDRFILVILDNGVTAMTGFQPTPGDGVWADGTTARKVSIEQIVHGCGVRFLRRHDPFDVEGMIALLREADAFTQREDGGVAVILAERACPIHTREARRGMGRPVHITEDCDGCRICIQRFECPALVYDEDLAKVIVHERLCAECGVCVVACPRGFIVETTPP